MAYIAMFFITCKARAELAAVEDYKEKNSQTGAGKSLANDSDTIDDLID